LHFGITQPESCYLFYYPREGKRLSRPKPMQLLAAQCLCLYVGQIAPKGMKHVQTMACGACSNENAFKMVFMAYMVMMCDLLSNHRDRSYYSQFRLLFYYCSQCAPRGAGAPPFPLVPLFPRLLLLFPFSFSR